MIYDAPDSRPDELLVSDSALPEEDILCCHPKDRE